MKKYNLVENKIVFSKKEDNENKLCENIKNFGNISKYFFPNNKNRRFY